ELPAAGSKTAADVARRVVMWANGATPDMIRPTPGPQPGLRGASRPSLPSLPTIPPMPGSSRPSVPGLPPIPYPQEEEGRPSEDIDTGPDASRPHTGGSSAVF